MSDLTRDEGVDLDDEFEDMFYGDDEPGEDQPEVETSSEVDQPTTSQWEIDGEQVDLDTIKAWREAHTNKENWTKSNTQKAQEIAEQRKQYEDVIQKYSEYEKKVGELERWNNYLAANPDLLQQIREYTNQYPNQAPGMRQSNPEVDEKIQAYEKRLAELEQKTEQERIEKQRQTALQSLKQDPNFKHEDFMKFFQDKTQNLSDLGNLYNLMWMAYKGANMDSLTRKAHDQAAQELKQKQVANVESGNKTPMNNLPNNIDDSASIDEMLEDFFTKELRQ